MLPSFFQGIVTFFVLFSRNLCIEESRSLRPLKRSLLLKEKNHRLKVRQQMNDLPVIGYHAIRNELWDRQGANIASR